MPIAGQPPASPSLQHALLLLDQGKAEEAKEAVTKAAKSAKARFGSGSHPLAQAYADMARLHYRIGNFKKAAAEFKHACSSPMPAEASGRRDRLSFMFGYGACLESLGLTAEAEKVFRQCVAFARNLHGPATPGYAGSLEPLASLLLRGGNTAEAVRLLDEAYDILWRHGDPAIAATIPARAEALKAAGRGDNAFHDLAHLPDDLIALAVSSVFHRSETGNGLWMRQVLADLLKFVEGKFGESHSLTLDTLAAIANHEVRLGEGGDPRVRMGAASRSVWTYVSRRAPAGLLSRLEVGFEPNGTIHLVPHLAREPSPNEMSQLEVVLTQAVDDLYARPGKKSRL